MRRGALIALAGALAVVAAVALAVWWSGRPQTLRLAVVADSEEHRVFAAMANYLQRERAPVRLRMTMLTDLAAAGAALEEGRVDLAVVRSDISMPPSGQTALIMRRSAAIVLTPPGSDLDTVAELRDQAIGVLRGPPGGGAANSRLLDRVLAQYDIAPESVRRVVLPLSGATEALQNKTVGALLVVGAPSTGLAADTVAAVSLAYGGASPTFVPIAEAKAIAQRDPGFESTEVVRGAFGGATPKPPETFETLGVTTRLVARASLRDATVGDLVRHLLAARPAVSAIAPAANRIEAPSTDKGEALPTHPGAAAFLDGEEETFFEKYSDVFYIGAMLLSVLGSAAAAILSRMSAQTHVRVETLLARLLEIHRAVRATRDLAEIDRLEHEADEILAATLESHQVRALDGHNVSALSLALHQVRLAIEDRRRADRAAPAAGT